MRDDIKSSGHAPLLFVRVPVKKKPAKTVL